MENIIYALIIGITVICLTVIVIALDPDALRNLSAKRIKKLKKEIRELRKREKEMESLNS
ncbi:MAG: hypothetical protein IJ986_01025 [Bacteroidales bacterium]|nr:hypothetical protein [Bacteroidales bacterium]